MTDQNHGNENHSGSDEVNQALIPTEKPKKRRRRRPRKRNKEKRNGSTNWQEMAKELDEKLRTLQEHHTKLQKSYNDLKRHGLGEREAVQLRRLKHLHARMINIQVCAECKSAFDSLLEDAKWI